MGGGPTNPAVLTFCEVDGPGIQIPRLCVGVGPPLNPKGLSVRVRTVNGSLGSPEGQVQLSERQVPPL